MNRIRYFLFSGKRWVIAATAIGALSVIGVGSAYAASAANTNPAPATATPLYGCISLKTASGFPVRTAFDLHTAAVPVCPGTSSGDSFAFTTGAQAIASKTFGEKDGIVTGGSFVTLSTLIGTTASLPAGTYQFCVNGKAEQPTAASGSVSAQLFLYDQAKSSSFAGDLLNVSADTQGGTSHDAYLNGCTDATLTSAAALNLYAFGYDSDNGAGAYNLIGATVTATQITPPA
jgi:hypothetical protein